MSMRYIYQFGRHKVFHHGIKRRLYPAIHQDPYSATVGPHLWRFRIATLAKAIPSS